MHGPGRTWKSPQAFTKYKNDSSIRLMNHNSIKDKFEYENNNRLTGKLKDASWRLDQSAWSLCPLRPAKDPNINDFINQLNFSDLRQPINPQTLGSDVWRWMNKSKRINLSGFGHTNITFATGVDNFIDSLILRSDNVGCLSNTYYFEHDICDYYNKNYYTLDEEIKYGTTVIIELPTPLHNVDNIKDIINKCVERQCYVALDITFLPVCTHDIELDVTRIDEIWFSMNKTWPISDVRPALRFSKKEIKDLHYRSQAKNYHSKISANTLASCMEEFSYDYIIDKYKPIADNILNEYDLEPTNNLWLGKKDNITWDHMPSKYWNYNNLIGIHRLIETHDI